MVCFASLGAGNEATFKLVPLRWPLMTAVAGGMIGEIGALGGVSYAIFAILVLVVMRLVARRWTKTWVGAGGRAIAPATIDAEAIGATSSAVAV